MAENNTKTQSYAQVAWLPSDVQTLRPEWSLVECEAWLADNASYIADAMVEHGWTAMEALL